MSVNLTPLYAPVDAKSILNIVHVVSKLDCSKEVEFKKLVEKRR